MRRSGSVCKTGSNAASHLRASAMRSALAGSCSNSSTNESNSMQPSGIGSENSPTGRKMTFSCVTGVRVRSATRAPAITRSELGIGVQNSLMERVAGVVIVNVISVCDREQEVTLLARYVCVNQSVPKALDFQSAHLHSPKVLSAVPLLMPLANIERRVHRLAKAMESETIQPRFIALQFLNQCREASRCCGGAAPKLAKIFRSVRVNA